MDNKKMIQYFLGIFPEHEKIYSETINIPLFELLKTNNDVQLIEKYCTVTENMWQNFGQYISLDFKKYIMKSCLKKLGIYLADKPRLNF